MISFETRTDIGGCLCVIQFDKEFNHYMEVKQDVRPNRMITIEEVSAGQVVRRTYSRHTLVPESIMEVVKQSGHHRRNSLDFNLKGELQWPRST